MNKNVFLQIFMVIMSFCGLRELRADPLVVGICGASGSGKSEFAKEIMKRLGEDKVVMLQQDNYYRPYPKYAEERKKDTNFDVPEAIDFPLLKENTLL